MQAMVATTNAFPVIIDEYRQQLRRDVLDGVKGTLRSAYNGQAVVKGGMDRDNPMLAKGLPAIAPIALVGEQQSTDEDSTSDRAIIVQLPSVPDPDARPAEQVAAFNRMLSHTGSGMAYSFVSWVQLHGQHNMGTAPPVSNRPAFNRHILNLGWDMLEGWLEACGYRDVLPEPNFEGPAKAVAEARKGEPIQAAIEYAIDRDDIELVWEDDEFINVQPTELVRHTRDLFPLPGRQADIVNALKQRYDAVQSQVIPPSSFDGKRKKVWRFEKARMVS